MAVALLLFLLTAVLILFADTRRQLATLAAELEKLAALPAGEPLVLSSRDAVQDGVLRPERAVWWRLAP